MFKEKVSGAKTDRAKLAKALRRLALQRLANGDAQADVARSYNVSQATISRLQGKNPVFPYKTHKFLTA